MLGSVLGSVLLTLPLGACREPTQLTAVLHTDVPWAPQRRVSLATGALGTDTWREPVMVSSEAWPSHGEIGSLVLVPGGARDATARLQAVMGVGVDPATCTPKAPEGCIFARRTLSFVPHRALVLPIQLHAACVGVPCDEDTTCNALGLCVAAQVDAEACARDVNECAPPGDRTPGFGPSAASSSGEAAGSSSGSSSGDAAGSSSGSSSGDVGGSSGASSSSGSETSRGGSGGPGLALACTPYEHLFPSLSEFGVGSQLFAGYADAARGARTVLVGSSPDSVMWFEREVPVEALGRCGYALSSASELQPQYERQPLGELKLASLTLRSAIDCSIASVQVRLDAAAAFEQLGLQLEHCAADCASDCTMVGEARTPYEPYAHFSLQFARIDGRELRAQARFGAATAPSVISAAGWAASAAPLTAVVSGVGLHGAGGVSYDTVTLSRAPLP